MTKKRTRTKTHYLLTLTAENDFRQARQWSKKRWGAELTQQYFKDLHEGAEYIAHSHHSLPEREELSEAYGIGVYPIREHYMVYVPVERELIIIVALIRQTRDVPAIIKANNYLIRRELKEISSKLSKGEIPNLGQYR